ncbi:MAG: Fe-S cluster assembly protein SufD [Leptospira sp.]|nr:Fe-S cluster assembly protein SufD [Leptospira sp.]NCS94948.1 Fe-S cluster assembly protein SufD [Leptospira sp.]
MELALRKEFQDQLQKVPVPQSTSSETWRKFNFKNFNPSEFQKFQYPEWTKVETSEYSIKSFSDLDSKDLEFINKLLNQESIRNDYFSLTNITESQSAIFVDIKSNVNLAEVLRIVRSTRIEIKGSSLSFFPLTIIRVGNNSQAKITEIIDNSSDLETKDFTWINSFTYIHLGENSQLEFLTKQDLSNSSFHFRTLITESLANSNLKNNQYYTGGFRGKIRQTHYLKGKGAEFTGLGLSVSSGREFIDSETEVIHNNDHTTSSILQKTIVKDKAHHIFTGNLHIPAGLKKVIASQVNHNISLTKSARAESIPKLEIFSEDVQTAHGSTVGEIDPEQFFYLQTRGLDEESAKHILIEAFLSEIIDQFSDTKEAEKILSEMKGKIWPTKN